MALNGSAANDDRPTGQAVRAFVFGCGYSAERFAALLGPRAVEGVTTRDAEKAAGFAVRGFTPFLFDGEGPGEGIDAALHRATHLLVSTPPGHEAPEGARVGGANARPGDPVLRWYRDAIAHGTPALRWIGYLSTVGVYGDHDGAWIDETAATDTRSARGRERVTAEEAWADVAGMRGIPLAVLRLSGIYGPGRSAFDKLRNGTARRVVKPGQVFNRIHVEDIAGAALHLARGEIGGIFNVTDDEPAPPQDVIAHAAELGGFPVPPERSFDPSAMSPMARSFWADNKRVSNDRLKATGYAFRYPTFKQGLAALVRAET